MSMSSWSRARPGLMAVFAFLIFGCGPGPRNGDHAPAEGSAPAGTPSAAAAEPEVVLFVGTSLTAGLGLDARQAYPARIQAKIDSAGLPFRVVNAGVSGETSAGARERVSRWLLRQPFGVLVLETGANDMLRGADLDSLRANLAAIVDTVRVVNPDAEVVVTGMMAPPNLGRAYAEAYARVYVDVAEAYGLPLVPFLLDGVGGDPEMNLDDGIHPNAGGHRRMADTVWETLEPVLREHAARAPPERAAAARARPPSAAAGRDRPNATGIDDRRIHRAARGYSPRARRAPLPVVT